MRKIFKKLLIILFVLLIVISLTSCSLFNNYSSTSINNNQTIKEPEVSLVDNDVTLELVSNSSAITSTEEAVAKVYDSVVCVYVMKNGSAVSAGSGVIVGSDEEGYYIVTCQHVVDGYDDLIVTLSNGNYLEGIIVGEDADTDLAVLKIKATNLKVAQIIDDSSSIAIGSEAIAIGNPLGTLANSVTKGIVSAVDRDIKMSDGTVQNLIQTDAAINGGNSGGGLFNNQGQLIGIVSSKYSATGVEGLAFAIPANVVVNIVSQLIEKGYVDGRTSLGLKFSDTYVRSGFRIYIAAYISYVDPQGSAYGIVGTDYVVTGVSVKFLDQSKESQSLNSIVDSETLTSFIKSLDLQIGDVLTLSLVSMKDSTQTSVSITLKQYGE